MILKIRDIHKKHTPVSESLFKKVALKFFILKILQYRYFSVIIAKFLRIAFGIEHRWLLPTWPCYVLWMIYELIASSSSAVSYARLSIITTLQLRVSKYKRENDKHKRLLSVVPT